MPSQSTVSTLITDLDNTLWDWFEIWYASFRAFLDALVEKTGLAESHWLPEIQSVHERHGTAEYAFVLEELPTICHRYDSSTLLDEFSSVIEAHRTERKRATQLYPTVLDTLTTLKNEGVQIIAFSESLAFYTIRRIRNTGLDGLIDYVYTPPDHGLPDGVELHDVRALPDHHYMLSQTVHCTLPRGMMKPAPEMLQCIAVKHNATKYRTIYIGDNLVKDIHMAQQAEVTDVHAKYGESHNDPRYELLRAVTHWSSAMVEKERLTTIEDISPTYVLNNNFSELKQLFRFVSFDNGD